MYNSTGHQPHRPLSCPPCRHAIVNAIPAHSRNCPPSRRNSVYVALESVSTLIWKPCPPSAGIRNSPEKPAEKRVIADLFRRNASFEHSSNKQQFLLFESHISPAFLKTNPEYFKRKIGSPVPPSPASYRGNADLHFSLACSTEVSAVH
jgi:hypothetical protein